ncbi:MAG TPA: hypothetical protein VFQ66_00845, partial [Candidatus Limnocylindria bacterium]|nr:hypothetical protein [Candidatus Limnocylindria bacterium]
MGTRDQGCRRTIASAKVTAGLKCAPESAPNADTATASAIPCASPIERSPPPLPFASAMIAPAPMKKNQNVPAASASKARVCPLITPPSRVVGYCPRVADFRPVEAAKARILSIRAAPADTSVE